MHLCKQEHTYISTYTKEQIRICPRKSPYDYAIPIQISSICTRFGLKSVSVLEIYTKTSQLLHLGPMKHEPKEINFCICTLKNNSFSFFEALYQKTLVELKSLLIAQCALYCLTKYIYTRLCSKVHILRNRPQKVIFTAVKTPFSRPNEEKCTIW